MAPTDDRLVSELLQRLGAGELAVEQELFLRLYGELKERAHDLMRRQPADHTLQTTALVHEAWLKLGDRELPPDSRTHFFRLASTAMRSVLVDYARARATDKRGGGAVRLAIEEAEVGVDGPSETLLLLDESLKQLAKADPELARVAEMRLFAGSSHAEIAESLCVSPRTVERAWRLARAWLQQDLEQPPSA